MNAIATRFRELHQSGLLILPNAWDAGSAWRCRVCPQRKNCNRSARGD